ncbi:vitamin K epoxide reductase complex subunit 1-like protein 1 [Maniola hyperantus]|uniref:vitamin K epoxide reductase complex subunit 1-like protein 1 n=1 Tax=Aphantopus hyperantus TaxID=2795564 RepID=UPI001567C9B2|nr:vitamin K epoxide reductase complex subunit 1-like protein 1 [Maniola hyperantus]XP_034832308.1 vitamin K epoxide reductase complex subunit 1-like protein 1 [Maniola hyperantus]XP_034832309.1 vitamin K epoxide reductase complex subunit 1-like protein 1 [Maniola hyperantus]
MNAKQLNRAIITISLFGVLVSTYALYVELLAELRPGYKALCDIGEHASCSKVLTSKYAKGLGLVPEDSPFKVPNCVYGIIFYCIIIFLTTFDQVNVVRLQLGISAASLLTCVYLAYLLIFMLKDFCLVCVTTYVLNIANAFLLNKKHSLLAVKNK